MVVMDDAASSILIEVGEVIVLREREGGEVWVAATARVHGEREEAMQRAQLALGAVLRGRHRLAYNELDVCVLGVLGVRDDFRNLADETFAPKRGIEIL